MAAFGNDLVPLVECCHWVGEGDLKLLREAEVTGSHFPAVGWSLADNRTALREGYVLVIVFYIVCSIRLPIKYKQEYFNFGSWCLIVSCVLFQKIQYPRQ